MAGRGHGGGTRARWRDADTVAGRGHGGRTRARWQDADKQRPYYGRGLGAWGHFPRKSNGCPGRWRGHGTWPGSNVHPPTPPRQAGPRRFYANHVQTPPTPVHGMQDAGTVAGRGHGGGTRTRWRDADKQRPYYGRGLGAWGHFPRKSNGCPGRWRGHGTWPGSNVHPPTPPRQAGPRRFYANHVQTPPTPVHGMQDAGTVAGRGHVGGTRTRWRDAGTVAGRGHGGRTRARWQDADTVAGRGHVGGTRARWRDAGTLAGRGQAASLLWTGIGCVGTFSA